MHIPSINNYLHSYILIILVFNIRKNRNKAPNQDWFPLFYNKSEVRNLIQIRGKS